MHWSEVFSVIIMLSECTSVSSFHWITCSVPTRWNSCWLDNKTEAFQRSSFLCVKREPGPAARDSLLHDTGPWMLHIPSGVGRWHCCAYHALAISMHPRGFVTLLTFIHDFYVASLFKFKRRVMAWLKWVCLSTSLLWGVEYALNHRTSSWHVKLIYFLLALCQLVRELALVFLSAWGCVMPGLAGSPAGSGRMWVVGEPVLSGNSCWPGFCEVRTAKITIFQPYLCFSL